jgi:hypothetical protein
VFPRVIVRQEDPTSADNLTKGFIEGNIWINTDTDKMYICIDKLNGVWVEMVTIAAGAGGDINFDIAPGKFLINAGNVTLNDIGNLDLTGEELTINADATSPPTDVCHFNIYRGPGDQMASIRWNEWENRWEAGVRTMLSPVVTAVIETRDPQETDFDNYFVGQTWINLVTQQKFTCVSKMGGVATWRLALTSAPTKYVIEPDDYIILYGSDDSTFMKISWNQMMDWIKYGLGLELAPVIPNYGFQGDQLGNIMPSEEDPITNGLFADDGNGDLTPLETPNDDPSDTFYELDANDDIMVKA